MLDWGHSKRQRKKIFPEPSALAGWFPCLRNCPTPWAGLMGISSALIGFDKIPMHGRHSDKYALLVNWESTDHLQYEAAAHPHIRTLISWLYPGKLKE